MEKVVMDCAALKASNKESGAINIQGLISRVFEGKKFKTKLTQFFLVKDNTGEIGVKIAEAPFTNEHIGADVEIDGGVWTSYESNGRVNWFLDATKAVVRYQPTEKIGRPTPTPKKTQEDFDDNMKTMMVKCFHMSYELMSLPAIADAMTHLTAKGWTSEDYRTVSVSLFIESNRSKGFIK